MIVVGAFSPGFSIVVDHFSSTTLQLDLSCDAKVLL